jgi:DNA-directed RNA polymerase subunit RPC12/RpoP
MSQPALVSTSCPTCAAPLEFGEGSNAIACRHCGSRLLVTGRGQVLSYCLPARVDQRDAAGEALRALQRGAAAARIRAATLYWVPYYRMSGHDLRWEYGAADPEPPGERKKRRRWWLPGSMGEEECEAGAEAPPRLQLRDRYIERNFVACDLESVALYSLGVRPAVLRLELFRRDRLAPGSRIVAATLSPAEAFQHGLKTTGLAAAVYRQVLGLVLSIVYHPYWVVETTRATETVRTIVDATGGKVTQLEAAASLDEVLNRDLPSEPRTAGFRPLVCPNCGWDLPLRPDDVIALCAACRRGWQIRGDDLREVASCLAIVTQSDNGARRHLPFWVLSARPPGEAPIRFHVPAFRYRRLKFLVDLARALAQKEPAYTTAADTPEKGEGCFYDRDDAARLASFVYAGWDAAPERRVAVLERDGLVMEEAQLTWLPYRIERDALIDPFTGRGFYRTMLAK